MSNSTIRKIAASDTIHVRHKVLRQGKPVSSCVFVGDDLISTQHFGYFIDTIIAGIVSVYEASSDSLQEPRQLQVRGMAVLDEHQRKGIGAKLMQHVEARATKSSSTIWFNARETAVAFYRSLGYEIVGEPFEIQDVGRHYIMYKPAQQKRPA